MIVAAGPDPPPASPSCGHDRRGIPLSIFLEFAEVGSFRETSAISTSPERIGLLVFTCSIDFNHHDALISRFEETFVPSSAPFKNEPECIDLLHCAYRPKRLRRSGRFEAIQSDNSDAMKGGRGNNFLALPLNLPQLVLLTTKE